MGTCPLYVASPCPMKQIRSAQRILDMEQASDDLCPSAVLTATNRGEGRPFLHQPPWSCSSGMKQPFESGPAGARTGPGKKIRAMLGIKLKENELSGVMKEQCPATSAHLTTHNPNSGFECQVTSRSEDSSVSFEVFRNRLASRQWAQPSDGTGKEQQDGPPGRWGEEKRER